MLRVRNKNTALAINIAMVVVGMFCLAYAAVPLYDLFCRVTGFGGTTQAAIKIPDHVYDREVTVRFNTDTNPGLMWHFKAEQLQVKVKVGESKLVFFTAENFSDTPLTGVATFNVTPDKAGIYFNKVQCFCFENQTIKPGEKVTFPVSFFIDPAILDDKNLDEVKTVTLSYTFFKAKNLAKQKLPNQPTGNL